MENPYEAPPQLPNSGDVMATRLDGFNWTPPDGVLDHGQTAIPSDSDFIVAPPLQIGKVLTARSSLKHFNEPRSWMTRGSLIFVGLILPPFLGSLMLGKEWMIPYVICGITLAIVAYVATRFSHQITYVGEQGACTSVITGSRQSKPRTAVLLFKDAAILRTSMTHQHYNGVYTGTQWTHTWTSHQGTQLLALSGSFRAPNKQAPTKDKIFFAYSTEGAWTVHILERLQNQFETQGFVEFPVSGTLFGKNMTLRLGAGHIDFITRGKTERLTTADVKTFNIKGGIITIQHRDAKWYGFGGKFSIPYSNLGNSRAFIHCAARLVGLQF